MAKPIVVVTGASGYTAGHVCKLLIESKRYVVRGTVRSKSPAKTGYLESIGVDIYDGCDLMKPNSFDKALSGAKFVHHMASPFFFQAPGGDGMNFVTPALEGTKNVLSSVKRSGTVERVVLTSSCAAVTWANPTPKGKTYVWSEDDWQTDNTLENGAYRMSKSLAEREAWKLSKELGFELVTICPSFILGPVLNQRADAASVTFMQSLIDGSTDSVSAAAFGVVDVRNVAQAHFNAMDVDLSASGLKNINGEARFVLSSEDSIPREDIAKALRESSAFKGWPVPTKSDGPPLQSLLYSNERARKYLNINFINFKDSIVAGCQSLVEHGVVTKNSSKVGAKM
eukprot:g6386.t1